MKELAPEDIVYNFEKELTMSLYTFQRYNVDANVALLACDEFDIDKIQLLDSIRVSDIGKKINDHYVVIIFTHVDHTGGRRALQKLISMYPRYHLKGSLTRIGEGDNIQSICHRLISLNRYVHLHPTEQIYDDYDDYQIAEPIGVVS